MDFEAQKEDRKTKSAVERELQIISEAAFRLGEDAGTIAPGPDWKNLRGMGNILRHSYHRLDDRIIWDTVKMDLPELQTSVLRASADRHALMPCSRLYRVRL